MRASSITISAAAKDGASEDDLVQAIATGSPCGREGRKRDAGGGRAVGRDRSVHEHHSRCLRSRVSPSSSAHSSSSTRSRSPSHSGLVNSRRCGRSAPRRSDPRSHPRVARHRARGISHRSCVRSAAGGGIQALFRFFDFELPSTEQVFALRTVVVALIVELSVSPSRQGSSRRFGLRASHPLPRYPRAELPKSRLAITFCGS